MPVKLLIVDDEAIVAESMRVVLSQLGYDVVGTVGSVPEAMDAVRSASPDLVLMDINLGHDQEGIAAAESIRREHRLPVVYVTAYSDDATLARAKISHPFGYVTKPFESRDLHIAIEIALHNHGLEQHLRASERALAEQAETYRAVIGTTLDGVVETDEHATILDVNQAYQELTGYSRAELVGTSIRDLEANETPNEVDEHTRRMRREGGDRFESRHRAKDGRRIDVEVSTSFIASRRRFVAFFRDISERKAVERTQRFLATAGAAPGEGFFFPLARFLAGELGLDYVCIDRLETDGLAATTLAVYSDGRFEGNLTYTLKDTPCGDVVGQTVCCFPAGVRQRFPRDAALEELQAESYVGVTLRGRDNQPIGLIAVIGRSPLQHPTLAEKILQLVAGRAAGELVRAQADAEIHRLLEFNRGTLDSLSAHLCVLDEAGQILAVNRAWREFAGANPPVATCVVEGANYLEVCTAVAGDDRPAALELVQGILAVARGEVTEYQQEYPCHAPHVRRWFLARVTRFFEAGLVRIVVAHVNLTDRKQAELALRESESNYRSLMDQAADGILIADPQGRYLDVNRAGCELLGRTREEILQLSMHDVVAPEDQAAVPVDQRLSELKSGRPVRSERRLVRKDGTMVTVEISARQLSDGRLQGIHRDVTERKRAEEELRRIGRWLFATQRISATGGWAINLKTATVWASPEARRIYGFGDGELSIPAIQEFPLAPYRPGLDRAMRELVTDGKPYDLEFQVARGSGGAIVDIRSVAEYNAEEHLVLGVVQDITERKRAERALRESEAKFRSYVDLAPVGVVVADETGRHIDANRATEQMLGYGPGGLIGTLVSDMPVPEDAEAARQHFSQVVSTGIADGEVRLRHRDGSTVWVAVRASKIGDNRFLAVYKDVSERKRLEAERERLMRDLARKNRELEHLIYVTSHDLRSPMLNIQGFSQRIEERCRDLVRLIAVESPSVANREELAGILTQHLPKALGYVRTSVDKMDALINGLLRLSRLGRAGLRREQLDLNAVLRDVRDAMAFPIQSAGVVIEVSPLPPCHGDAGQINQVFTNLLDNAIKYRDPVRPLRITVTGRVEGARAIYCVADTGRGIAAKHRDRIWEIFFRANPEGPAKGEGIGLNLVRRIVERHDGEIWVESTEGEGSRFHVALPTTAENGPVQVTGPSELDRPVG